MLGQNWEAGLACPVCEHEIGVGEPILYGKHPGCARKVTSAPEDPVQAAQAALDAGGRVAITKKSLRALSLRACERLGTEPVRRPDRGQRGVRWYARVPGWSMARVEGGLSVPEISGLFLDALDVGRTPPISHEHLKLLIGAAREEAETQLPSRETILWPSVTTCCGQSRVPGRATSWRLPSLRSTRTTGAGPHRRSSRARRT